MKKLKKYRKELLVIVALIILGGAFVLNTHLNNEAKERLYFYEQIRIDETKEKLDTCVTNAWVSYISDWDKNCEIEGLERQCILSFNKSDRINKSRQTAIENCIDFNK